MVQKHFNVEITKINVDSSAYRQINKQMTIVIRYVKVTIKLGHIKYFYTFLYYITCTAPPFYTTI